MQADDFFEAYGVLNKKCESGRLTIMGPSIVCLALSLELYLKDLYFASKGTEIRGHHILKLFDALPREIRREVFRHKAISQNSSMLRGKLYSVHSFSSAYSKYHRFRHQVKQISEGFIKWRYSHEERSLRYDSFVALALIEAVKSTADRLQFNTHRLREANA